MQLGWAHQASPYGRRIVCRRFGASIGSGLKTAGCKSDSAIAESVNPRQSLRRQSNDLCCVAVLWPTLKPESVPSMD
ncbi:hypothetical protein EQV90_04995 [Pseudomonas sp. TMW22089]|nr:hypothetical protein [Pseudomonas sp. TMW22089]